MTRTIGAAIDAVAGTHRTLAGQLVRKAVQRICLLIWLGGHVGDADDGYAQKRATSPDSTERRHGGGVPHASTNSRRAWVLQALVTNPCEHCCVVTVEDGGGRDGRTGARPARRCPGCGGSRAGGEAAALH